MGGWIIKLKKKKQGRKTALSVEEEAELANCITAGVVIDLVQQ